MPQIESAETESRRDGKKLLEMRGLAVVDNIPDRISLPFVVAELQRCDVGRGIVVRTIALADHHRKIGPLAVLADQKRILGGIADRAIRKNAHGTVAVTGKMFL